MSRIILFNKPFGVLSQFTGAKPEETLANYIPHKDFYAAGRLDKDSEGLLLLTDDGKLQQQISNPKYKQSKVYLAQVEGLINEDALSSLRTGIKLKDGLTLPAKAKVINSPDIWPRVPAIRERKNIPTSWLELSIKEGRNRQVRRMTAAVGYPTLRLIRASVGQWELDNLQPGQFLLLEDSD